MTFAIFDDPNVDEALDYLARSSKLAAFVGAGVSAEAGMPNWSELIRRLLAEAAERVEAFSSSASARSAWVERVLSAELPPAAAGIAEILLGKNLPSVLRTALFTPHEPENDGIALIEIGPKEFFPGPTAHAIAALRMECAASENHDSKMRIFTTNYDDLIERAFRSRADVKQRFVQSVTYPDRTRSRGGPNYIRVRHLNGLFRSDREKHSGRLTLTDESFNMSADVAAHRDDYVVGKLADKERSCIFLGSSFSDPNIIRYIDKAAERRRLQSANRKAVGRSHVAVFTHHGDDPEPIQAVREEVTRRRLDNRMTKVVYLDHYADVPVFVRELRSRLRGSPYVRRQDHAREVLRRLLSSVVAVQNSERYDAEQPDLNDRAVKILGEAATELQRQISVTMAKEPIAMAIWLLDVDGKNLTPWITTDRVHRGPELLQRVCVQPSSRWLAVRSVCAGRLLKEERNDYRSRWRYLLAFPLEIQTGDPEDEMDTVTIGAVSLTSMFPVGKTALSRLGRHGEFLLRQELGGAVAKWLVSAASRMGE